MHPGSLLVFCPKDMCSDCVFQLSSVQCLEYCYCGQVLLIKLVREDFGRGRRDRLSSKFVQDLGVFPD